MPAILDSAVRRRWTPSQLFPRHNYSPSVHNDAGKRRLPLLDDSVDVYREADLDRLRNVSDEVGFLDPQSAADVLAP